MNSVPNESTYEVQRPEQDLDFMKLKAALGMSDKERSMNQNQNSQAS